MQFQETMDGVEDFLQLFSNGVRIHLDLTPRLLSFKQYLADSYQLFATVCHLLKRKSSVTKRVEGKLK